MSNKNIDKVDKNKKKLYEIPILLVGDTGTGKSTLLHKIIHEEFDQFSVATIGILFEKKQVQVKGVDFYLLFQDSPGQDCFQAYTNQQIRGCNAFFCIFDLTQNISFVKIKNVVNQILQFNSEKSKKKLFLIGTMIDKIAEGEGKRDVSNDDALQFAQENSMNYYEISSKTSQGFDQMFKEISNTLYNTFILPQVKQNLIQNSNQDYLSTDSNIKISSKPKTESLKSSQIRSNSIQSISKTSNTRTNQSCCS